MAITKVIGTTTYNVPTQGARGWGPDTTNLLARLADVAQQVVTAQYILTTDTFFKDVSGQFGLKSNFLKGVGAIASADGFIRMASPHANPGQGDLFPSGTPEGRSYTYLSWRNTTNDGNLHLFPNSDNATLQFAGTTLVNLDTAQTLSNKILDNTNQVSGLAITAGSITDTQIAAAAAIALSKLAALTADRLLVSDVSGVVSPSSVTSTEAGYLSGVTSAIQTQLNTKQATGDYITAVTGDVTAAGPGSSVATIAALAVSTGKIADAAVTATKLESDSVTTVKILDANVTNAKIAAGVDAVKIGAGAVDNTEFGYLDGVTSAIQTQLNAKQGTGNYITDLSGDVTAAGPGSAVATIAALAVTTGKINDLAVTDTKLNTNAVSTAKIQDVAVTNAKVAAGIDAVKIGAGSVDNTEFGYLNGVTSAIQTQLDARILSAILTTKGDLLTRNASTNDRLPVGVNGQVLSANSATATGLEWVTNAAGLTNPMTTLGDVIYGGSGGAATRLAGNTTTTRQYLTSIGSGGLATAPTFSAIPDATATESGLISREIPPVSKVVTVGGATTSPAITVKQTRIGKQVTISFDQLGLVTKNGANGALTFTIDADFAPTDVWIPNQQIVNNVYQIGMWRIQGTTVSMFNGMAGANITASVANTGWDLPLTFTYQVP